jgi:hypothetical protein
MRLAAAVAAAALLAALPAAAAEMIAEPVAVLLGLDKVTARVSRFEAPVGKPVAFGTLSIVVRACETNPPEERPENAAFLQIYENKPGEPPVSRFSGWMFSSSPALSALEHPVYDVSVLGCKTANASPSPGNSAGNEARPASAAASSRR